MEKGIPIFLSRLCVVSKGCQDWTIESVVLVYRATRWRAIDVVVKCVQHPSIRVDTDHTLCCVGGILMPHTLAHDESTTTCVVGMRSNRCRCDTAEIWSMES